jgi:hypothetical protein
MKMFNNTAEPDPTQGGVTGLYVKSRMKMHTEICGSELVFFELTSSITNFPLLQPLLQYNAYSNPS